MFVGKDIVVQTAVIEKTSRGPILGISFKGIHNHHWPYGKEIHDFIKEEVRRTSPAAVIFNFMEYYYEQGNEIGDPFMTACVDTGSIRPFAVVAKGITAKRLKSLFIEGSMHLLFKFEFLEDSDSACVFLRKILAEGPTSG